IAQLGRKDRVLDCQTAAFQGSLEFDLPHGADARIPQRAGPQLAEGGDQFKPNVRIKARHQIVDASDRLFNLSLNGIEIRMCTGVSGADKSLKRYSSLLLYLLKRRHIANSRAEPVEVTSRSWWELKVA